MKLTVHAQVTQRDNFLIGLGSIPIHRTVTIGKLNHHLGTKNRVAMQCFDGALG